MALKGQNASQNSHKLVGDGTSVPPLFFYPYLCKEFTERHGKKRNDTETMSYSAQMTVDISAYVRTRPCISVKLKTLKKGTMLKCLNRDWCPFSEDGCHELRPLCRNYRPDYGDTPPEPERDWAKIRAELKQRRVRREVGGVVLRRCRGCGEWFREEDMLTLHFATSLGRCWCEDCAQAKQAEHKK